MFFIGLSVVVGGGMLMPTAFTPLRCQGSDFKGQCLLFNLYIYILSCLWIFMSSNCNDVSMHCSIYKLPPLWVLCLWIRISISCCVYELPCLKIDTSYVINISKFKDKRKIILILMRIFTCVIISNFRIFPYLSES